MHVGIVSYDYSPPIGGLGIVVGNTAQTLREMFPENIYSVISPSPGADEKVSRLAGYRWKKKGGCPLFSLLLNFRLKKIINAKKIDVLHVHSGSGGVFLLKKPACPMVVTAHHSYLQEAETVFFRNPLLKLWKKMMAKLEKRTYILADRIICVSNDTADTVINRYKQSPEKVSVIENGIPAWRNHISGEKTSNVVFFAGRLEERKGIWVLLKAFDLVHKIHPSVRLRVAGQNLIGQPIFRFIKSHDLQSSIDVMGFLKEPLLQRELRMATMIVIPSLLEGFGLVAAEAMSAGTCVVASDSPGLRSIIKNEQSGLLFSSGNSEKCADCINRILNDLSLRKSLEDQAKIESEKRFSLRDRTHDVQKIIEKVITSKG
jgi:glycosyltransferase involved in cell wall biosynthesis